MDWYSNKPATPYIGRANRPADLAEKDDKMVEDNSKRVQRFRISLEHGHASIEVPWAVVSEDVRKIRVVVDMLAELTDDKEGRDGSSIDALTHENNHLRKRHHALLKEVLALRKEVSELLRQAPGPSARPYAEDPLDVEPRNPPPEDGGVPLSSAPSEPAETYFQVIGDPE